MGISQLSATAASRFAMIASAALLLTACGGGSSGGGSSAAKDNNDSQSSVQTALATNNCTVSRASDSTATLSNVKVSGVVSFDFIPLAANNGLDYDGIQQRAARAITVQAVTSQGAVVDSTTTDHAGRYQLSAPANQAVTIRARAELKNNSSATWDVRVEDNTQGGALYVLDAEISNTLNRNMECDLHAESGWSSRDNRYSSTRAAGPFAIADAIYTAIEANVAVQPSLALPALTVNWSTANTPAGNCSGGINNGCIGTSYYSDGQLYLLGAENLDTDEHDAHVVTHEWAHFFEDALSRSDSLGGQHSGASTLDIRVAMAEGFANAAAAIFLDDHFYRDSSGGSQNSGFMINVEHNEDRGWFNEDSVQSLIFDIADSNNDGSDTLAEGWAPLFNALTAESYKNSTAATSIFALLTQLRHDEPSLVASLNTMAASRGINGVDEYGNGETNNAGDSSDVLPLYTQLNQNSTTTVCATDRFGSRNRLSVRRLLNFTVTETAHYRFSASASSNGSPAVDPDLRISRAGEEITRFDATGNESGSVQLEPGDYMLEASEFCFVQPGSNNCSSSTSSRSCIDVNMTRS